MKMLTYADWLLAGYQVRKGEKAKGRDTNGEAVFSRDQVDDAPEWRKPKED